jgi:ABC-type amino acid transport substrate-binding protein
MKTHHSPKSSAVRPLVFLLAVLLLLCPFLTAGEDYPPDIQRILERGKIIVAMYNEDVAPFFMHDREGNFFGFDVELARDIADNLDVDIEFNREAPTFDAVVDQVFRKKADVAVSMLSGTLERAKKVRFTDSYIILHQALLINRLQLARRKRKIKDPVRLLNHPGTRIGEIKGTSYVGFAMEDFPRAEHVHFDSWDDMVAAVLKGDIMALLYDEIEIQNWHHDNPEAALYLQTIIRKDRKDPLAIAVHWKDAQLQSWLNQYLNKIRLNGMMDRLVQKYIVSEKWRTQ